MNIKSILPIIATLFLLTSCHNYEDFSFTGTVVDFEYCESSSQDFGYLVSIDSPDNIGDSVLVDDGTLYPNVIVLYQSPRILTHNAHISGTIYIDNNYNRAHCSRHYTYDNPSGGDPITLSQAVCTSLKILN